MSKRHKIRIKKRKGLDGLPHSKAIAESKKSSAAKWALLGLGVAATGALSYFGFQYWKKHKQSNTETPDTDNDNSGESAPPPPNYQAPKQPSQPKETTSFPLIKGSKGTLVKSFQDALIAKYGKAILPKYGADGDFGSEMLAALKKLGLGESITETTYNVYVKGSSPDHATVAKALYLAAVAKDFNKAIGLLKTLRNTDDYKAVSDTFVNYRIGSVRQTLVNGMLNSFSDTKQKDAIRLAFSNMGLKYDGSKWSLSGIDNSSEVITIQATRVWKNPKSSVSVPANMVLGKYITNRGAYTLFKNDEHYFIVETQHVKKHN